LVSLLVLIGLAALLVPVLLIYLLVAVSGLKAQLRELEAQVAKQERRRSDRTDREDKPEPWRPGSDPAPVEQDAAPSPAPAIPDDAPVPAAAARAVVEKKVTAPAAEPKVPPAHGSAWGGGRPDEGDGPEQAPDVPPSTGWTPPEGPPPPGDPGRGAALGDWLVKNWIYVVSAISLALAGIFLVQYGIEQGLLPPPVRVLAAMFFGGALVYAGERIRRRSGDGEQADTAYLPSVFSGAGIVTLFGAVLAARMLYDLIGPGPALAGMAFVGAGAILLGWFHGPLLAAVGIVGAMFAPFMVGGETEDPSWLFFYFALIAAVGLSIDTMRHWRWMSGLTVALAFLAGWMLRGGGGMVTQLPFMIYTMVLVALTLTIPVRRFLPNHRGAMMAEGFWTKRSLAVRWQTTLAAGAVLAAVVLVFFEVDRAATWISAQVYWTGVGFLVALALFLLLRSRNAPALTDLSLVPALGLFGAVSAGEWMWRQIAEKPVQPNETGFPLEPSIFVGLGLLLSLAAAYRSLRGSRVALLLALVAVLFAPVLALQLELTWQPAERIGANVWGLHALAIAAVMTFLAERFAHRDGPDHRLRMALAVLSALSCIAFALLVMLTETALTLALTATVVVAAGLDKRFDLPQMKAFILLGTAVVLYRLVGDPGVLWAEDAPIAEVILVFGGAIIGFLGAQWVLGDLRRPAEKTALESAALASGGILVSILALRGIEAMGGQTAVESHWSAGIGATIWILVAAAQAARAIGQGLLSNVQKGLAALFLLFGLAGLFLAVAVSPLALDGMAQSPVLGPILINTLAVGYLLPAAALWTARGPFSGLADRLKPAFNAVIVSLAVFWGFQVIRHFWRGAERMALPGFDQPELYSYTMVLLVAGGLLFYQALAKQSEFLRKAGLAVIGLAIAKVFLIDMAGLVGLLRVFSFLFLGLALAGLAWLNRWAARRMQEAGEGGAES